jgi:hypothetical protein
LTLVISLRLIPLKTNLKNNKAKLYINKFSGKKLKKTIKNTLQNKRNEN